MTSVQLDFVHNRWGIPKYDDHHDLAEKGQFGWRIAEETDDYIRREWVGKGPKWYSYRTFVKPYPPTAFKHVDAGDPLVRSTGEFPKKAPDDDRPDIRVRVPHISMDEIDDLWPDSKAMLQAVPCRHARLIMHLCNQDQRKRHGGCQREQHAYMMCLGTERWRRLHAYHLRRRVELQRLRDIAARTDYRAARRKVYEDTVGFQSSYWPPTVPDTAPLKGRPNISTPRWDDQSMRWFPDFKAINFGSYVLGGSDP
eukprot:TRINITY_DN3668_c0_g1_i1.p2 TRINITY_DN3668_c0_g1~~TRINITY_DN3668_c0_g1_i1.p2  ORF type:complete len:254 (+),score=33.62 TRINITY_DN3668_c0_g1_i1:107-868(+)